MGLEYRNAHVYHNLLFVTIETKHIQVKCWDFSLLPKEKTKFSCGEHKYLLKMEQSLQFISVCLTCDVFSFFMSEGKFLIASIPFSSCDAENVYCSYSNERDIVKMQKWAKWDKKNRKLKKNARSRKSWRNCRKMA